MEAFIQFIVQSVRYGTPLLFGTTGEIITQKSGSLNLGVEGVMAVGAIGGFLFATWTNSLILGILAAFALAAAVLAALLVFRRQADDRALLAAAVVLAIGVPFLLPHMHERYFFLADVLALAWTCAFPRSAPCALLVELASAPGGIPACTRTDVTRIDAPGLPGRFCPASAGAAYAAAILEQEGAFPA